MGKSVGQQQLCDGNARGTGAVYYHAAIFLLFTGQPESVDDAGQDHNGGATRNRLGREPTFSGEE